jgi:hypothetical protein
MENAILAQAETALNATNAGGAAKEAIWWSTTNAMTMSSIVLFFGLVVLGLSAWLVKSGQSATSVLRIFGTILVIVMATFLVVAGYDDKQIAAPLGLLGTIVGYLLGRESDRSPSGKQP